MGNNVFCGCEFRKLPFLFGSGGQVTRKSESFPPGPGPKKTPKPKEKSNSCCFGAAEQNNKTKRFLGQVGDGKNQKIEENHVALNGSKVPGKS